MFNVEGHDDVFVPTSVPSLHVKGALSLGCLLFRVIANQSGALCKAKVKGQQGAVLQADGPQSRAIDLQKDTKHSFREAAAAPRRN